MTTSLKKVVSKVILPFLQSQYVPVRYRYHAEKIARGPIAKKFGYKDKVNLRGFLPDCSDKPLIRPTFRPVNPWSPEKARRGQNDYIDILGGAKLTPHKVSYEVPKWLRGRKGNEFQLLLLKQKIYSNTLYHHENPTMWYNISKRVRYLYRYLNCKTKTGFSDKQ